MNWFKQNALQIVFITVGIIFAWGTLNARVSALENKLAEFPSADYFNLKFDTIQEDIDDLEILIREQNGR